MAEKYPLGKWALVYFNKKQVERIKQKQKANFAGIELPTVSKSCFRWKND